MAVTCSVFIATSVDGFIARPDGDIAWLHRPEFAMPGDRGLTYDRFIATVDAIVMGRNTFEKVLTFGFWPYEGTPVVVLSRRGVEIPAALRGKAVVMAGSPQAVVARLAAEGKKHLYIDGGVTIQAFLEAGLIDELTITQLPILLGEGIPLFGAAGRETSLQLVESTVFDNGIVQLRYRRTGSAA